MINEYEKLLTEIDAYLNSLFEVQKAYIACKKGCDRCCSLGQFPLSRIEFEYLFKGYEKLDEEAKKIVITRIKKLKKDKKNRTPNFEHKCPFLIGAQCSVYSNRPLICRTFGLIKTAKTVTGQNAAIIPDCVHHGLNYSNIYNFSANSFDEKKISQINSLNRPEAYDISLESIYKKHSQNGVNFGETKKMIDFIVEMKRFINPSR